MKCMIVIEKEVLNKKRYTFLRSNISYIKQDEYKIKKMKTNMRLINIRA